MAVEGGLSWYPTASSYANPTATHINVFFFGLMTSMNDAVETGYLSIQPYRHTVTQPSYHTRA